MCVTNPIIKSTVLSLAILFAGASGASAEEGSPEQIQLRLNILSQYFEIVDSFHAIADDPEKAIVFNLQQIEENYKKQGKQQEIVKMYEKLLKEARSSTLRNIAVMKLSEIYKSAGRNDEAIALLEQSVEENLNRLK